MNIDITRMIPGLGGGLPARTLGLASSEARHQGRSVQAITSPAAQLGCVPAPDAGIPDLSASLRVNYQAPWYIPPEKQVPQPGESPTLKNDEWLSKTSHQPVTVENIEQALEKRRDLKAQGLEDQFTFEPLVTTLENMAVFIRHIRDNKQFAKELDEEEDRAMAWLEEKTAVLIKEKAPYKRTVQLAMALMTVCEELTNRRILIPLKEHDPLLFNNHCGNIDDAFSLERLIACSWGGNNTGVLPENEEFFTERGFYSAWEGLTTWLDRDDMLLYPSFQVLGLKDFCNFSHLPVHPIGMITDYTCNADGKMMSPLLFAMHDFEHMRQQSTRGQRDYKPGPGSSDLLCVPSRRLALRQLLLDSMPAALKSVAGERALELLLFELFHEKHPGSVAQSLGSGYSAFLSCLQDVAEPRRHKRAGYPPDTQKVTDTEASMAAFWVVRLWEYWQTADFALTPRQLQARTRMFMAFEAPRLQEHLDFIDRHRGTLRHLFAGKATWSGSHPQDGYYAVDVLADGLVRQQTLELFKTYDPTSGLCHLDNTDRAYFSALRYPDLREEIERRTGELLPADLVFDAPMLDEDPGTGTAMEE